MVFDNHFKANEVAVLCPRNLKCCFNDCCVDACHIPQCFNNALEDFKTDVLVTNAEGCKESKFKLACIHFSG